jgi:hypothetical protein
MKRSKLKDTFFLMKEEKSPCPKCHKKAMQFTPNGSSGFDLACIFTCTKCGEEKQEMDCCTFYAETIRNRRKLLVKYGIFQLINRRNPDLYLLRL